MPFALQLLVQHLRFSRTLIAASTHSRFAPRKWLNEQSRLLLRSAVSWIRLLPSSSKPVWTSYCRSSPWCAMHQSRRGHYRHHKKKRSLFQHSRNSVWIRMTWKITDQFPTCRLCQRLLRNLFLNSYRFTWLKTTYFRSFNPVSAVIIQLSRLYSECSPTFIPPLTVEMLHCSLSLTSVPHLTRLTTLSCWRDCLRLSAWVDKPTRGSTRTSLADLNPCGWGTLHHLGHRSVSVFLKDRYSGQSCTSSIPPMLPGLSNHSGSRFTCTPTTLKSTVPAVSHDRSSYPNFSFSSLAGLMTGCRLTVFVSTRIRRNLSGSVLDTSCLTSTLVQSLSSLHRHRFAIWVWCLILNWQWRDISPNYVSRASSSFVASGPSVIHSLAMHYLCYEFENRSKIF